MRFPNTISYIRGLRLAVKSAAMKHWPEYLGLPALIAAAALAGCSTNPITGRSQFMVVSENMAVSESAAAYGQMMGQLGKKKQIEADTPRVQKVREITDRLIAQAIHFR